MELPKETIERIEKEAFKVWPLISKNPVRSGTDIYQNERTACINGMKSEALRSLSEIEKLKEDKRESLKLVESIEKDVSDLRLLKSKYEYRCYSLESQNKELMEALRNVYENVYAPEHGRNPNIESLLKSLPNKEA